MPPTSTYIQGRNCPRQTDPLATREVKFTARWRDQKPWPMRGCPCTLFGTKSRTYLKWHAKSVFVSPDVMAFPLTIVPKPRTCIPHTMRFGCLVRFVCGIQGPVSLEIGGQNAIKSCRWSSDLYLPPVLSLRSGRSESESLTERSAAPQIDAQKSRTPRRACRRARSDISRARTPYPAWRAREGSI